MSPLDTLPEESPFANWARRLIIGPREMVSSVLQSDAQRARDEALAKQKAIEQAQAHARSQENIRLQIGEQSRATQAGQVATEGRKQALEDTQRGGLMDTLRRLAAQQSGGQYGEQA